MITINISHWPEDCPLCERTVPHMRHCVPFYEEPRSDLEIGGEVGGMTCCYPCYTQIYRIEV